jgi:hypothetical protein
LPGRHAICGYVVHAEYPLQGLPACAAEEGPLGRIDLRAGPVAEHLDGGTLFGSLVEVTPEAILIKPFLEERELGRILIRAGREIVVAAVPGAELELEPFILGSGMGAISLQQGLLPLHASAVATETGAIAFSGPTGAGKSTLAMTLTARGHTLLTDDLMLVGNADGAVPLAYPGTPTVRLTVESATALGLGPTGTAVQGGKQRHRLPVGAEPEAPRPLEAIYLLEEGPAIRIEPISPIRAFPAITAEAYRHGWYAPMGLFEARMKDIASLTRRIGCFRLVRPHRFEVMGEVADAVLAHRAELSLPKG